MGVDSEMPLLLEGTRIGGTAAIAAGLADELVAPGEEVEAAERWVLSRPVAVQPWDRLDRRPVDGQRVASLVAGRRAKVLAESLGHYPAPLAILDSVEQGFPQNLDDAIRTEMKKAGLAVLDPEDLDAAERDWLRARFLERVKQRVPALLVMLLLGFLTSAACSFRGGDFTPMPQEAQTPCVKEAEQICKDKLGSADFGNCKAREKYRCEVMEEEQKKDPNSTP